MQDILEGMAAALERRPHLLRLGRLVQDTVLIRLDDGREWFLHYRDGRIAHIEEGPSRKTPWRFGIVTDREALDAFWQQTPKPGFHDIFGLAKIGRARIEGDVLALVKTLRFHKEVLALPRGVRS
ncbi:hypothetical protein [Jannaschia sp. 2305UL9-9]|uniref:hypothetical protein n=1 Tax=Jannaschia sp. 2305UL9-9 TaxID=3121638 RepID=UPI003529B685